MREPSRQFVERVMLDIAERRRLGSPGSASLDTASLVGPGNTFSAVGVTDAGADGAAAAFRILASALSRCDVATDPKAAIAAELAVAVERRETGQLDGEAVGIAIDGPGDGQAAPGVAGGERLSNPVLRIETEFGRDVPPGAVRAADAVGAPASAMNSSDPSVKRPSASICQTKRSG